MPTSMRSTIKAHALPFDRYLGRILLLLAFFQPTVTWFFSMCRPCDHLCVGRKGSPQATIGPFSGSAFVALSCGQTKNRILHNITNQVVCSWAASPAPTSTPPPHVRIPLRLLRQYAIIDSPSACLCASLARESMGEVGHKIK